MKDYRKKMIAKVHIGKRELGMDDGTYRLLLIAVTGKDSCKYMTEKELDKVLNAMYRLGFLAVSKKSIDDLKGDKVKMVRNLMEIAEKIGAKQRLILYVRKKYGVEHPRFLRISELRRVFAFLREIERRQHENRHGFPL